MLSFDLGSGYLGVVGAKMLRAVHLGFMRFSLDLFSSSSIFFLFKDQVEKSQMYKAI